MKEKQKLLNEIFYLAETQPKYVSSQLNRSLKYKEHFKLLCELTEYAPLPIYPISEKIWLLKNSMTGFPTCKKCGKPLDKPGNFIGLTRGFRDFCSCKCSMNSDSTTNKRKNINKRLYGVDNVFQNEDIKRKSQESCYKRFGVKISTLNNAVLRKQRNSCRSYYVDGLHFDSSLECCFYVYNRDHNIKCEYTPDIKFQYQHNGKNHWYFPDFKLQTGEIVEIKGGHFFKDGKMICPFKYKKWSDQQYQAICDLYEAKHQCMLLNSVKILTENELDKELKYMKDKYGVQWRQLFKSKQ